MAVTRWPKLATRPVASCRIFDIRADTCRSPRTGKEAEFFVIESTDWVNVIAFTDDDQALLVKQHRFGIDELSLEIPGGMIDGGEDPLGAAQRELVEETGYVPSQIVPLGVCHPNPALQANRLYSFLATCCRHTGKPHLDGMEDIDLVTVPRARLDSLLATGQISHSLVLAAFLFLKLKETGVGMTP